MIAVTESLHVALRYVRRKKERLVLWADAICINQDDNQEKNHQVALMSKIYSYAEETLIWLGKDKKNIGARAFKCLLELDEHFSGISQTYRDESYPEELELSKEEHACLEDEWIPRLVEDVWPLFGRAWFTRLWSVKFLGSVCIGYLADLLLFNGYLCFCHTDIPVTMF